jgi:hypothetical protein
MVKTQINKINDEKGDITTITKSRGSLGNALKIHTFK